MILIENGIEIKLINYNLKEIIELTLDINLIPNRYFDDKLVRMWISSDNDIDDFNYLITDIVILMAYPIMNGITVLNPSKGTMSKLTYSIDRNLNKEINNVSKYIRKAKPNSIQFYDGKVNKG